MTRLNQNHPAPAGRKSGMAIPMVLGFVFVATIMGSTLIFLSRVSGSNTKKSTARLQHIHFAQMGITSALAAIKPMKISEIEKKHGRAWKIKMPQQKIGKDIGWYEVKIIPRGDKELQITSAGFWLEPGSQPMKRQFSCTGIYKETRTTEYASRFGTKVRVEGEWKFERFKESMANDS